MKNGLVIADIGPIFSLALIDKLHILDALFDEYDLKSANSSGLPLVDL